MSDNWINAAGGSWTVAGNWDGGVPTAATDATIGVANRSSATTVTAAGLANTGTLILQGTSGGVSPNQATLDITGAAPATLSGLNFIRGDADLEFATGGVTAIASGGELTLEGS